MTLSSIAKVQRRERENIMDQRTQRSHCGESNMQNGERGGRSDVFETMEEKYGQQKAERMM